MKVSHVSESPKTLAVRGAGENLAVNDAIDTAPEGEGVYDGYVPINALYKQLEFDSTGEWLTLVINESDVEAWYGKIF